MDKKKYMFFGVLLMLISSPEVSHAMHIMEGFLPVEWAIFWAVVSLPFLVMGLKKINKLSKEDVNAKVLLGLIGGFVFVLSALKIPSLTGSSSHPTGVGLGAILFGPTVMTVVGTVVLLFQAILLAHGGVTTLGANIFSMAIVGPLVSFGIYTGLKKTNINKGIIVFMASALGNLATYCVTATQLAFVFPDSATGFTGALVKFLSVFAFTQLPLAIVEGILTVIIYNLLVEYKSQGVISIENI